MWFRGVENVDEADEGQDLVGNVWLDAVLIDKARASHVVHGWFMQVMHRLFLPFSLSSQRLQATKRPP